MVPHKKQRGKYPLTTTKHWASLNRAVDLRVFGRSRGRLWACRHFGLSLIVSPHRYWLLVAEKNCLPLLYPSWRQRGPKQVDEGRGVCGRGDGGGLDGRTGMRQAHLSFESWQVARVANFSGGDEFRWSCISVVSRGRARAAGVWLRGGDEEVGRDVGWED